MKRLMAMIVAGALVTGCTDPYGNVDPLATGLAVGAGALAVGALGYAAGQNSASRNTYNYYSAPAPRYYHAPAPRYYHAPRYHYAPRRYW